MQDSSKMDGEREVSLRWRANVLEQALSQLGQGIIMLNAQNEVLYMTPEAEKILALEDGLAVRDKCLVACRQQDHERLNQALMCCGENIETKGYTSFYIHRTSQLRPYLVYASATHFEEAQDTSIMLIVRDTQANMAHWVERLKAKYKLTNREAEITVLLTEGRNTQEISCVMEISEDTTRQYLKNCYKKMDVQKQHELVCLALDSSRRR